MNGIPSKNTSILTLFKIIILAVIALTLLNTVLASWVKNEFLENEMNKLLKILIIIPPFGILTAGIIMVVVLIIWVIREVKTLISYTNEVVC